jgi:hypothetical protein
MRHAPPGGNGGHLADGAVWVEVEASCRSPLLTGYLPRLRCALAARAQRVRQPFNAGDLVLADRGFSTCALMAGFPPRQVEYLGQNDRGLVWNQPSNGQKPRCIPKGLWNRLPQHLPARMVRFTLAVPGYRTRAVALGTLLLDPVRDAAAELAERCARRGPVASWFRDRKTLRRRETLRCLSPRMIHKELVMFFLADNALRCLTAVPYRLTAWRAHVSGSKTRSLR